MQSLLSQYARDESYKQTMQREDTNIQRNIIRKMLIAHPEGITDLEICILTGFSRSSVCARRNEIPEAHAVGFAKITDEYGGDRLNTLWGIVEGDPLISCGNYNNGGDGDVAKGEKKSG